MKEFSLENRDQEGLEEYGKAGFGVLLLVILVVGTFRPAVLSGIPILFAAVTFLGGINIIAGVTALIVAITANIAYIMWAVPVSLVEKGREFKDKHF